MRNLGTPSGFSPGGVAVFSYAQQRLGMLKAINHGRPAEPRWERAKQFKIIESQKQITFVCNLTEALLLTHWMPCQFGASLGN
jgi:hypothetical protein